MLPGLRPTFPTTESDREEKKLRFQVLKTATESKNGHLWKPVGIMHTFLFRCFPNNHAAVLNWSEAIFSESFTPGSFSVVGSIGTPFRHLGNTRGTTSQIQISRFCWNGSRRCPVFKLSWLENECFLWFPRSIIPNTEKANKDPHLICQIHASGVWCHRWPGFRCGSANQKNSGRFWSGKKYKYLG